VLPEEIAKLDDNFKEFQVNIEGKRRELENTQQLHRDREEKLKRSQDMLKRIRERLSEVKTNKEYEAVLKEIEVIEKKNSEAEDEIIILLEKIDDLKDVLREEEKEVASHKKQYEEARNKLEAELNSMDQALQGCRQKGVELRKRINDQYLKKYESIKLLNNGLAVVPVWKEVCEGCHMKIPAQLYNEVQKFTDLCACPNCSRIIYWQDQSEGEN